VLVVTVTVPLTLAVTLLAAASRRTVLLIDVVSLFDVIFSFASRSFLVSIFLAGSFVLVISVVVPVVISVTTVTPVSVAFPVP
jgi:hypothetical protein